MKKISILLCLWVMIIVLTACQAETTKATKVLVPFGAPAFAQVSMEYQLSQVDDPDFEIEIVYGADNLAAAFNSESHEIIYAPSNLGARLIKSAQVPYQYLATISRGNLYLATKDTTLDENTLNGREIIAFGENATPGIVLETIINEMALENTPTIRYVDSVNTAAAYLAEDNSRIVLLAEPILSVQAMQLDGLSTLDLQAKWSEYFKSDAYPQAGVFVHEDLAQRRIDLFESLLKDSINKANTAPQDVANDAVNLGYELPEAVLKEAIPRSNLSYIPSDDAKASMELYFEKILNLNPNLIGGGLPDDYFYKHLSP